MGRLVKGGVVAAPFPFSNLAAAKRRLALVVTTSAGDDVLLCQITSHEVRVSDAISLVATDFLTGGLNKRSNLRPNRLFTADSRIAVYRAGTLKAEKVSQVISKIVEIITR